MSAITLIDVVKPYSTKELAEIYGICDKTFKKWIKPFLDEIGIKQGRYYNVIQVKIIFAKLGVPCKMKQDSGNE